MQPDGNGANEIEPEKISGNELDIDDPNADGISGNELSAPAGVSANELPEENNLSDQIEFNEMELTPQMVSEKQALSMHLDEYEEMVPSCDYVENQAVFLSDSLEEAQKIAECYQAELKQYAYGVAVIQSDATAKAMVTAAADLDQKLPPVYYNGIVTMDEVPAGELSMDEVPINEVPADELSANQIGPCAEQWFHDYIGSKESWEYTDGSDILVAVIDTGVRYTHLDLIDNCVDGYDFVNEDSDPMDDQGHGTHVAGTIAGISSNEIGGCGVAPNSKIMPLKVLSSTGKGSTANVMTAVEYAVEHQADIINLSLGSSFYSEVFQEVINHAVTQGVVVVGAAGNDGSEHMHYPAAYEGTISVASLLDTTENMGLRDASNYGSWVDIAAPGTNIYATVFTSDTAYGYKNGTSMACPVVAGTIALMMDADPSLKGSTVKTVKQIDSLLKNTEHRIRYYNSTGGSVYGGVYAGGATGIRYYQKISSPVFLPSEILDQKKNIIAAGEEDCYLTITSLPGSRVYYTTNGKIPTDNSTLYTGPIPMKQSGKLTIKAIAYVGKRKSAVATKTYQLNAKAVKVEFYGGTQYHVARGKNIRLSPVFTPTYTTSKSLTYQSSNPAIRVNAAGVVSCKANTAPGTAAVISATTKDGSGLSISTNVIVVDQATKTLTLNAKEVKLSAYPTDEFAAGDLENEFRLIPSVTNDQSTGFLYTTSNKKVAT
ncbi:MAG: S8 family serine peptidase, partial [Clostridia bacterium]|nr:S8 family serine peptidase [Clostridia bacterium]